MIVFVRNAVVVRTGLARITLDISVTRSSRMTRGFAKKVGK